MRGGAWMLRVADRTLPRLVGLRLQTLAVKAGKRVDGLVVGAQAQRLHVVLQVGMRTRGIALTNAPSCEGAMLIGPGAAQRIFERRSPGGPRSSRRPH